MPSALRFVLPLTLAIAATAARGDVIINELMYHPASEEVAEEYIELFNSGATAVDMSGWQFTNGVQFTFPNGRSIAPGEYLVVAANSATFQAKYPVVTSFVGGWSGQLSNSSNRVTLRDSLGVIKDDVAYSDDGDWSVRQRDVVLDFGHRGWDWESPADGFGRSLELINPGFDNQVGQNWLASVPAEGTPGAPNSVASNDIAPVILDVGHFPLLPKSTDSVSITARFVDDHALQVTGLLHYRNDGVAEWSTTPLLDDGAHGDGLAGDGVFGATLLPQANGTIVEFYLSATDSSNISRTWPAPGRDENGVAVQEANCLYQVDDAVYAGAMPIYRMIMRAADRAELTQINTNNPPISGLDQTYSHARMNTTFVTSDGTGLELRYRCGARNRGNGSRSLRRQSINISFTNEDKWKDATSLNLNSQYTPYQLLGSTLFRKSGLTMAESRAVQIRVNGAIPADDGSDPDFPFYVANETQNSEFLDHHFPLDSSGNLYRGQRNDTVGGSDLSDESDNPDPNLADPTPYRINYFKETNASEDRWGDLIGLTQILAKGHSAANYSTTYDPDYVTKVEAAINVDQWMRFFAVNVLADNSETNITMGEGDDFYLYFGEVDPRSKFIAYDLDTILGRSASSNNPTRQIFRMSRSTLSGNPPTALHPFMVHPKFAPAYFREMKRLLDGPFSAAEFNPLVDTVLGGLVDPAVIQSIKTFNQTRTAYVASLLPLNVGNIVATDAGGTALAIQSGYPRSTAATCRLVGKSNCVETASVKVNGVLATYVPWRVTATNPFTTTIGEWQASAVTLRPGVNRILIQAFNTSNEEIDRGFTDVWYDDASVATVSGSIAANTTWTAAGGPYQVSAALTVNNGVTLTIQPGTTVYLASGVGITVAAGGRILAEGTESQPIRFTRAPGATGNGSTITINGQSGAPETHFYYTFFEFGGDPALACEANSNVVIDHCEWLRNDAAYLHLDGGSFLVSNCIFPSSAPGAYFEGVHGSNAAPPAGGRAIIRGCFFGKISSNPNGGDYNDVLDFTGGNRPGPILQIINNVFIGTDDDILDIDGTDLWAEGNIFMHVHRKGSPDSASAVSGGNDGGGGTGSRRSATAIDAGTNQVTFGSVHGFSTGQEVVATTLLGNAFPAATPPMHNGSYFARVISTTIVKLYNTAADANADTNAVDFTGTIGAGVSLSLCKLDAISHITIVGNLFYDIDHAAMAKEGNFYTFLNNTVVAQNHEGSEDTVSGVLNFGDESYHEGGGMYAEGNVIHSAEALTRHYPGGGLAQTVVWNNNLFPQGMTWSGAGSGNESVDARLNDPVIPTPGPRDYIQVAAQIREMFGLRPGSPAKGTGPNGTDKGGVRALGVSISGAPSSTTNATNATLTVGTRMTGNGIPSGLGAWQNGSGWTHYKWRMNGGAWSAETPITMPISLSGLQNGVQTVEVAGKNDANLYQDDAALGSDARVATVSWTVDTNYVPPGPAPIVQINEVLAKNTETINFGANFPDIIELRNAGNAVADIAGWGLTDNTSLPFKYTFPAGTTIAPGGYLVVYASGSGSVPQPKTGFGLKEGGDTVTLTRSVAAGGGIADAVPFGAQLPDYSCGRRSTDGAWDLCVPTFGAANIVAAQNPPSELLINEWLADAVTLFGQDFVEIYNPTTLPTNIGKGYLTDNPVGHPDRHEIRQLTFVAPSGYISFKADGDVSQGPDHLDFKLAAEQGEIALFDPELNLIDIIVYGPQSSDVSEGRTPNGGASIVFFNQPTPGAPNPGDLGGTVTTSVNLIPATKNWTYYANTAGPPLDAQSRQYFDPGYDDSAWLSGGQLLYLEDNALNNGEGFTKSTLLPGYTLTRPYQTYYFRTHFTYDGSLSGVALVAKLMVDDGCVIYLNGQEILPSSTNARIGMNSGPVTNATQANRTTGEASVETFTFPADALVVGDNVLAVEVHQVSVQSPTAGSSDIVWGMKLDAAITSAVGGKPVVLNEVLTLNTTLQNPDGSLSGWVELYNPTGTALDLSDMSLSNVISDPRRFVLPAGTSLSANGYLVIYCNGSTPPSPTNTGFALSGVGGQVYLFKSVADGGGLHDSVAYGFQVSDYSIGREPNGSGPFALSVPTRGGMNQAAGVASVTNVKLNEWLGTPIAPPSWFELFNTGTQPAPLGGNYLTDLLSNKTKFLIPPLSFIGGGGNARWLRYFADNDNGSTPGHVNFSVSAGEALGLFSGGGVQLDAVAVSALPAGLTQGRFPDGASTIVTMPPTPAAMNSGQLPDSDGDGIPDYWENAYGLNSGDPSDGALDPDGDGRSNKIEYLAGTDPRNGSSNFAARVLPGPVPGQWSVRFVATVGKTYSVFYKNSLTDTNWTKLSDVAAQPTTAEVSVMDLTATGMTRRFYQVVTPQAP
ncbi:MAG TPA: lamin tail domain-containing protein [Chthoniobacteraceae bacterium]|nr:lamin tail domain-containing protein [Chthoniobacteraceae bacterium]